MEETHVPKEAGASKEPQPANDRIVVVPAPQDGKEREAKNLAPGQPESPTGASSPAEAGSPGPGEIVWVDEPGAVIIVGGVEHHPAAKGKKKRSGERLEPERSDKG